MFGKRKKNKLPKITWYVPKGTGNALVPRRATDGAMAYDIISPEDRIIPPATPENGPGTVLISTLVAVEMPREYGMILGSRSSLASKNKITVEAGWIDSDYRGILKVLLYNHSTTPYTVKYGDRIAQAKITKIQEILEDVVEGMPDANNTSRGAGGFGSTGK